MQDFVTFWSNMFTITCEFLLAEPVIWFIGIFILILLVGFLQKLLNLR